MLAVLLLHMAAALEPQSVWHQSRRLLVRRCSRAVMVAFLLLLPLQGLAAWRGLELAPLMAMGFAVSARRSTPPPRQAPVLP